MKEYGGYIELDTYRLQMLHESAIALNCGRNCLAYIIKARSIKRIAMPFFMCDSVFDTCKKYGVDISFYHIDYQFRLQDISLSDDEWLYIMNYYGQLSAEYIFELKQKYDRIIIDNAQAYFEEPTETVDTLYTCRKFFGVADGAFLYTDSTLGYDFPRDESYERMRFLLGRYERTASEFYAEYVANNDLFADEPIKKMSKLTDNLLHAIDYKYVKERRTENFRKYHARLQGLNELRLHEVEGAFAYPLLVKNGSLIRKALQKKRIYIPMLWPNVVEDMPDDSIEYVLANNTLPLPCDQRYDEKDIDCIVKEIIKCLSLEN